MPARFAAAFTTCQIALGVMLSPQILPIRFAFARSSLEQFYLPLYIKTSIAPSLRPSGKYQMLLMSDRKGRVWYAREVDVAAGSTPQANAQPTHLCYPMALASAA
jgi:hypothetical protein